MRSEGRNSMLKKSGKKLKTLSKLIMAIGFCISTFCGCFTVASAINNYQPQGAIFGIFILAGGVFFAWVAARPRGGGEAALGLVFLFARLPSALRPKGLITYFSDA